MNSGFLSRMADAASDFIFPRTCTVCGKIVEKDSGRHYFCKKCLGAMPYAGKPEEVYLKLTDTLKGSEIYFDIAFALLDRKRDEKYINTIYELKYNRIRQVGRELGRMTGELLLKEDIMKPDFLQPVPLHPAKRRERSFNQALEIALGISGVTGIPVIEKAVRKVNTQTQTKLSIDERSRNVKDIFELNGKDAKGNVMIVDDVMTTGATVNNLAKKFREARYTHISVASVIKA